MLEIYRQLVKILKKNMNNLNPLPEKIIIKKNSNILIGHDTNSTFI